jgi:photosystem II stability/assembly factor-like uncharacterized protein
LLPQVSLLLLGIFSCCLPAQLAAQTKTSKRPPVKAETPQAESTTQTKFKGIWEPVSYPEDVKWQDVFFATADEGWVGGGTTEMAGGLIIHTTDGGTHWEVQYGDPQSSERAISEFRFLDATHGWAVQRTGSASRLLHTRDGQNWVLAGTIDEHHNDYMFTSETTGVSLSSDVIKVTADGGRSWKPAFPCQAKIQVAGLWRNVGCEWRRLQFLSPAVAYAVAKSYDAKSWLFLAKTTDGGLNWSLSTTELTDDPEDSFFVDENTGYVRAGYPDTGQLFKTTDGGQTWTGMATSPGRRIQFADPEVGWALHYNKVSFTTNGGNRWNSREYPFPATTQAFSLPRRDRGYVVGEHGMIYRYRIVPEEFTAKGVIPAPLLSGINSPLDAEVEQLANQVQALAAKAGVGQEATAGETTKPAAGATTTGSASSPATTTPSTSATSPSTETGAAAGAGGNAGGFAQDVSQAESTLNQVSSEVPKFVAKYKNLNLLIAGFQTGTQLPSQVLALKESFATIKKGDAQSVSNGLLDLRTKVNGLVQMVRTAFQKPR